MAIRTVYVAGKKEKGWIQGGISSSGSRTAILSGKDYGVLVKIYQKALYYLGRYEIIRGN